MGFVLFALQEFLKFQQTFSGWFGSALVNFD
jgi:hypothetical protein